MVTLLLQPAPFAHCNNDLVAVAETNNTVRFLKLELFHYLNANWTKVFELNQFPNPVTKRVAFNFKNIAATFFKPSFGTLFINPQPDLVHQFYFKYTEIDADNNTWASSSSDAFKIVYGSTMNEAATPTDNIIAIGNTCGLFMNLPRSINPLRFDSDFFINYFHTDPNGTHPVYVKFFYTDGTFNELSSNYEMLQYNFYTLNICNTAIKNSVLNFNTLQKIEIRVATATRNSETITLIYDHTNIYKPFAWHFLSSCGGWQTIAFKGDYETQIQRDFEESEMSKDFLGSITNDVYPDAATNVVFPSSQIHNIKTAYQYKGDLGYLPDELSQRAMLDLFASPLIVQRIGNKLMQVIITSKNISLGNKNNSKRSIPVEWKYAHSNLSPKNYIA